MARPLRVVFPGAWYHVMNRGAARAPVFVTDVDASSFLNLLGETERRFGMEVHGYCLMENHYHALVRTRDANLSLAMRHLDGVFTQRAHRRRGTDGPIFRGRFKSVLVQAGDHLLTASRYIHLNPTQAGLVRRPEEWIWSSYGGYLESARAQRWLHTETILGLVGTSDGRERYRDFVNAGIDRAPDTFYCEPKWPPVLGDEAFVDRIRQEASLLTDEARREMPEARAHPLRIPLDTIATEVSIAFTIYRGDLRITPCRRDSRATGRARGAFVEIAHRHGRWRMAEIATWLGYRSNAGPYHALRRFHAELSSEPDLRDRLGSCIRKLRADRGATP